MMRNQNRTGRTLSMPAGVAAGTGISMGLTLILSMFLARLVSTEKLEWDRIGYGIIVILLTASVMGTKAACVMIRRRKLMLCIIAAVLYWLSLLMTTALFFGGQYDGIGVTGIVIFSGSAIVCLGELKKDARQKTGLPGRKRKNNQYKIR